MPIEIVEKNIGETCLECAIRCFSNKKKTYVGILDPMARGKLMILTEDDVKLKEKYLKTQNKTYELTIICGIKTDSDDILGKITDHTASLIAVTDVINEIEKFPKTFNQNYHPYSAYKPYELLEDKRKPLWYWTAKGLKPKEQPSKEVSILNRELLDTRVMNKSSLKTIINTRINMLTDSGSFRKDEIKKQWEDFEYFNTFEIKYRLTITSGFYVRTFINDISEKMGYPLILLDLNRTEIH